MSNAEMGRDLEEIVTMLIGCLRTMLEDDALLEVMSTQTVPGETFTYAEFITDGPLVEVARFNERWGVKL